jgi:hypothetical protein
MFDHEEQRENRGGGKEKNLCPFSSSSHPLPVSLALLAI